MKLLRKALILSHRYLGIALGLLIIVWFASGIVMMYAGGMPTVTPQARLDRLPELDLSRIGLAPGDAVERVRETRGGRGGRGGGNAQLLTVMERPAYRVGGTTVFADTGELMGEVTLDEARLIAARFAGVAEDRVHHARTLTRVDQWTLQVRPLPIEKFHVEDGLGTEIYVQPQNGEVAMMTTRKSRMLAWAGTIPHWLYFTALRANQPLWYRIVVWTSAAATVLAAMGLLLAVTQFRRTRPLRLAAAIPYTGWMRWHYITGAVFGVFTLTWAFSGLLSMEPFAWTNAQGLNVRGNAFTGGQTDLSAFPAMDPAEWNRVLGERTIRQIDFTRIQDQHYYVVRMEPEPTGEVKRERLHQPYYITGRTDPDRLLVAADTLEVRGEPFSKASLMTRLEAAVPDDVHVLESGLLAEYDSYYYSRGGQLPLPVLRVKFDDPAETWVYIDPEMSEVMGALPKLARLERWLYNGLHSLDFKFWYNSVAWDVGMIVLLLGGLATTSLGLLMGLKRMKRGAARAFGG